MKLSYITNSLQINSDLEIKLFGNGESADQNLTLYIAPAYDSRAKEEPFTVAYIKTNSDPYPFAIENSAGEIYFGEDAFGPCATNYARDKELSVWLNAMELRDYASANRLHDKHFLWNLADELERLAAQD
jgi:hypothetical protein